MSLPATMSGVQLIRHGGPEVLVLRHDLPIPEPGAGEVLVRVLAAGVNNTDIATRLGWYSPKSTGATVEGVVHDEGGWSGAIAFPRIQGAEFCGRIAAIGAGVIGWQIGQRVVCPTNQPEPTTDAPTAYLALGSDIDGAFAQFCVVAARHLHDVGASPLTDVEIAAMPCAFGTAENLLTRAGVADGARVLITGASGGVGLAAVQLAKLRGAIVTAQCSPAKERAARDAGAAMTIDRGTIPPKNSLDVVIDLVGGPNWPALIDALRPGGHLAVAGAIAGPMVSLDLRSLYLKDITLHGCTFQPRSVFSHLVGLINSGSIRPLVSATFPLSGIAEAQAAFVSKRLAGKIVLLLPEVSA